MQKIRSGMLFIIVILALTGCSTHTDSFQGTIDSTDEGSLQVGCSDEINKGKKNVNSIGYICSVNVTKDTVYHSQAGEPITFEDFEPGSEVKVILSKQVNFKREYGTLPIAKEIILVKRVEFIEPYDFNRNEVQSAVIYYGDMSNGGSEEIIVEMKEVEQLNELSDILQTSQPFSGNATADWNYTIVVESSNGESRIIEITGGVHVFTDRTMLKSYTLDKTRFMEFIHKYQEK